MCLLVLFVNVFVYVRCSCSLLFACVLPLGCCFCFCLFCLRVVRCVCSFAVVGSDVWFDRFPFVSGVVGFMVVVVVVLFCFVSCWFGVLIVCVSAVCVYVACFLVLGGWLVFC